MLVLSRRLGERIVIGPHITMTVVEIHHDRVKLAFEGPREVPIHREEIYRRIHAEELGHGSGQHSQFMPEFA